MSLTVSDDVVLIPSGVSTGTVTVSWNYPFEIKVEERIYKVGSASTFTRRPLLDTQTTAGSYSQVLTPGDVYEVRVFERNFNGSGMSDAEKARWIEDEVIVHALLSPGSLQTDFNEKVGGTFYRYSIATGSTLTHAVLEVGKDQPVADAAGFRRIPDPIMTITSFAPSVLHSLTTDNLDLLPEDRAKLTQARWALIRVSDASGTWEQVERSFRTLKRTLTINFHTVDVQSLGEAPSETEAEMRFKLEAWDFDGQTWSVIQSFVFENHNVTLTPFKVTDFVPNPVVVIGPRRVGKEVAGLALHVQEFDPWPFEDEHASSMVFGKPQIIKVTPGENNEDKTLNLVVKAAQPYDPFDTEQEVDVDVHVLVTVSHV